VYFGVCIVLGERVQEPVLPGWDVLSPLMITSETKERVRQRKEITIVLIAEHQHLLRFYVSGKARGGQKHDQFQTVPLVDEHSNSPLGASK